MKIFPAIDLYEKKAVRLLKGDYQKMTVYADYPVNVAKKFESDGCKYVHIVDLEGAKFGTTPNIDVIKEIVNETSLFVEVGGGIRNIETVKKYIDCGVNRVILGTSAVTDEKFLKTAISTYGDKIAVGVDIKDGFVAIRGWVENSTWDCFSFCEKMEKLGVSTIICTDISKDGAMQGTNTSLYRELSQKFKINITASGGVSNISDILALKELNIDACIIGKAYYIGAINLKEALQVCEN